MQIGTEDIKYSGGVIKVPLKIPLERRRKIRQSIEEADRNGIQIVNDGWWVDDDGTDIV